MDYKRKFENFTEWFFDIRKKIETKEFDIFELKKDIEDLCLSLLKNKILDKIRNAEFPISMHHKTNLVNIGGVLIGGQGGEKNSVNQKRRVVVQSMAMSSLNCVDKLFDEFIALAKAGSKIIRIAVTGISDAKNIEFLCKKLEHEAPEYSKIPIVMCGQYNVYPIISQTNILDYISKLRINPGNICLHKKDLDNFASTIKYLVDFNKNIEKTHPGKKKIAIRIGVNWGSLDERLKSLVIEANAGLPEKSEASDLEIIALVLSVIFSGLHAEFLGFEKDLIVASCKTSEAESAYLCSKLLSLLCDYPIHLGITEAGSGEEGVILSAMGLGRILSEKIGDTMRVSITPKIGESRTREVIVAKQILSSVCLLSFKPKITSCPGCGRTDSQYFRVLAEEVGKYVDQNLESWCSKYENEKIKDIKIAVMGCLVNGTGEMGHAHIGISLPGFRENNACLVYLDGEKHCVLKGGDESVKEQFFEIIEFYIKKNFSN